MFSDETKPDFPSWDIVPNLTVKSRQILKRSLGVCFHFDKTSKFVSSSDVICKILYSQAAMLWMYPTVKVSKGHFSKSWGLQESVSFSCLPSPLFAFFALAPIFAPPKSKKCLEREEKPRKGLLRRLFRPWRPFGISINYPWGEYGYFLEPQNS